jgi:glycosyltransferase involved in cell wall biosynthesis
VTISIVIPAHNEAEIIVSTTEAIVGGLRARSIAFELWLVENGSTDATYELAEGLAARFDEVHALTRPVADYGRALRAGFLAATGDVVVNFDTDFYDLDFLERATALVREPGGPVIVVGTKRGRESHDERALIRRTITRGFSLLLKVGFGLHVSDTHGVKAMRRTELVPIVEECKLGADLFDTELVLRAERAGMATDELPVSVIERRPARTSILQRVPRAASGLVRMRLLFWREARDRRRSGGAGG